MFPSTTFVEMVQNCTTFGKWYSRVAIIVTALTALEMSFLVAIILRIRATMKVLRSSNYIETRMRQASFRFLLWSTILPYLVLYVYEIIARIFRSDYFNLRVWLKETGPRAHVFVSTLPGCLMSSPNRITVT